MTYSIRSGDIRWQIYYFYVISIVMFALSLTKCEIFTKLIKRRKLDVENESQDEQEDNWDLYHLTRNVRFHMRFFKMLATWEHAFTQKGNEHTYTYTVKTWAMTIGKVYQADLPNNKDRATEIKLLGVQFQGNFISSPFNYTYVNVTVSSQSVYIITLLRV